MKLTARPKRILVSLSFFSSCLLFSCTPTQRIAYFQDVPDTAKTNNVKYVNLPAFTSPIVRVDDILNVNVQTLDPQANMILNQGNLPIQSGITTPNPNSPMMNNQNAVSGYLVNKNGDINMPYIGTVHVQGLTTNAIHDTVLNRISVYFKNPVVNVRFANFKVTVLGEVRQPATFSLPNEKPTVLDALGLAGDITIYGKRNNVLLVRDAEGKKEITRLDLDNSNVINSPYFYLKPNDVLYVEPTESRVASTNSFRTRDIAVLAAGISLLTVVAARLL
jgi:polysaccharide export outer membrane protein